MVNIDTAVELRTKIFTFSDNSTAYAHQVVFKVCCARRSATIRRVKWKPNDVTTEKNFVKDWRGKWLEKTGSTLLKNVLERSMVQIGASLFCCEAVNSERLKTNLMLTVRISRYFHSRGL